MCICVKPEQFDAPCPAFPAPVGKSIHPTQASGSAHNNSRNSVQEQGSPQSRVVARLNGIGRTRAAGSTTVGRSRAGSAIGANPATAGFAKTSTIEGNPRGRMMCVVMVSGIGELGNSTVCARPTFIYLMRSGSPAWSDIERVARMVTMAAAMMHRTGIMYEPVVPTRNVKYSGARPPNTAAERLYEIENPVARVRAVKSSAIAANGAPE